jgi:HSP20 family protein
MSTRFVPLTSFDRLAAGLFDRPTQRLDRQIPVDAVQRGDQLVLEFDMPGVTDDAVELSIERRVLTVRADRASSRRDDDHVFLAERPAGAMSRQIVLGDTLDLDAITAHVDRGVLTVTIPVSQQAKSRKIEIGHAPVSATSTEADSSN